MCRADQHIKSVVSHLHAQLQLESNDRGTFPDFPCIGTINVFSLLGYSCESCDFCGEDSKVEIKNSLIICWLEEALFPDNEAWEKLQNHQSCVI